MRAVEYELRLSVVKLVKRSSQWAILKLLTSFNQVDNLPSVKFWVLFPHGEGERFRADGNVNKTLITSESFELYIRHRCTVNMAVTDTARYNDLTIILTNTVQF